MADVTADFEKQMKPGPSDRERHDAADLWVKKRTAECEKGGSRCRIASFFGGLEWLEIEQLEIQDVRLVYAPPEGIGNFGGEADNWRWPRARRRLLFLPGLCPARRKAGPLRERKRPVPAEALAPGFPEGGEPGR